MSISFDRAADFYDATRGYPPGVGEQIARALLDAAGATPASRILELGVGTGRIALPIIRAGYAYTGIDLSPRMLDKLRAALPFIPDAEGRVTLREGDATSLPFPDASFDIVISVHVLHLLAERERAIAESVRVLARPGVALNGRDEAPDDEAESALIGAWRETLRDLGWPSENRAGHAARHSALQAWQRLGGEVDRLIVAEWVESESPAGFLEGLERRLWSSTWAIPDALYTEALRRLRAWATAHYGAALDQPIPARQHFLIERARFS